MRTFDGNASGNADGVDEEPSTKQDKLYGDGRVNGAIISATMTGTTIFSDMFFLCKLCCGHGVLCSNAMVPACCHCDVSDLFEEEMSVTLPDDLIRCCACGDNSYCQHYCHVTFPNLFDGEGTPAATDDSEVAGPRTNVVANPKVLWKNRLGGLVTTPSCFAGLRV